MTSLQKHIGTYSKTRDIDVQYRQSGYGKKFSRHMKPTSYCIRLRSKNLISWGSKTTVYGYVKKEYATLFSQKNKLYGEYKQARQEMVDLQMAKHNIDRILNVPQLAKTIKSVSHEEQ